MGQTLQLYLSLPSELQSIYHKIFLLHLIKCYIIINERKRVSDHLTILSKMGISFLFLCSVYRTNITSHQMNILQLTLPDKHYIPKYLLSHSLLVKQIVYYNETIIFQLFSYACLESLPSIVFPLQFLSFPEFLVTYLLSLSVEHLLIFEYKRNLHIHLQRIYLYK